MSIFDRSGLSPITTVAALAAAGLLAAAGQVQAGSFGTGDVVVQVISTANGAGSNAVALAEYNPTTAAQALPLQTLNFPNAAARPTAAPFNLTDSANATSDGYLSRTVDGHSLVSPGYNGINGDASIASSSGATITRTIGVTTQDGTVDTSRSANFASGNNFRSVASADGTSFYAGAGNGIYYISGAAPGTSTTLATGNARIVNIFNNQLYASSSSTSFNGTSSLLGIYSVGSGTPTTGTPTLTNVVNTGTGSSPYDFAFSSDASVVYIADDRATASGGIQKWTFDSGTSAYTLAYTLGTGASNIGARGLAVDFSGANPVLYATSAEATGNRLIEITDTGAGSSAVTLATAASGTIFRGVDFAPTAVPEPTSLALLGLLGTPLLVRRRRDSRVKG